MAGHGLRRFHSSPRIRRLVWKASASHHADGHNTNQNLVLAPMKGDPDRVLDIGAGTGIWCNDLGDVHPASNVIGVDLAPQQPEF